MTLNGTELVITQNDFVIKGKTYPNVPVIILLNGEVFQVVTSTTDGTFEYKVDKVIENGEYYLQVKVYKDGLESNPSPPIKFVLASLDPSLQQLEIVLWQKNAYEGSTILIRVYDKTTGQPVSGARVVVQDEEYVTDAEGFAGKRGSPIHRGVKIKPNYNRQIASALRRTIGFASTTDDSFDTENEITIYAVIEEGTYKKYGTKKVVLLKQDKKNLFLSPNNDGINDIVAVKNLHNPVKIFDLRGRLVRTLYNDNGTIYWDGKDEDGKPLPSGVYLYLTSDGQKGKIYVGR
jgi:gliding motility-associated-like protein